MVATLFLAVQETALLRGGTGNDALSGGARATCSGVAQAAVASLVWRNVIRGGAGNDTLNGGGSQSLR